MPKFTFAHQRIIDSLQRDLDDVEKRWPMTGSYERIDPYITPYLQGGTHFELIIYHLETRNWYDKSEFDSILHFITSRQVLKSSDVVFDVGSNAGAIAVVMASIASGGHVYAFDPYPWNPVATRHNAMLNGLSNVTAFNVGLAKKDETLSVNPNDSRSYVAVPENQFAIQLHDYRRYLHLKPTYLKFDIEGAEHDLFLAPDPSTFASVRGLVLELHPHWLRERGLDPTETLRNIQKAGFSVSHHDPDAQPFNIAHYQDHCIQFWGHSRSDAKFADDSKT